MESLEILNGQISPKYDKSNDIYTVNISNEIDKLDIKYLTLNNEEVNVYGNLDFEEGENKVIISVTNDKEIRYITLFVNKEQNRYVGQTMLESSQLNINNKYAPSYTAPLIFCLCSLIILIIYYILFKKKKKKNKSLTYN